MHLRELQSLFWAAIRHPVGVSDFLGEATELRRAQFEGAFVQTPGFSRQQRVGVYAESYFWRFSEVLGEQYRVVSWLAGPTAFHNLLTDFVWAHPSTTSDLRRFGEGLAVFMAKHAIAAQFIGIEDLAQVERAIAETIDAPDVAPLGADALAARPLETWPTMRLVAAPWVKLHTTRRSYPALYEARRREEAPPAPSPEDGRGCHAVLTWRTGLEVFHRSVPPPEARALRAMLDGESFDRICAAAADLSQGDPVGPEAVVAWLQRWIAAELICELR